MADRGVNVKRVLVVLIPILLICNFLISRALLAPRGLVVSVLAVEKGDAVLLRTPKGSTVLIDTGSDASILRALGTALPEWQKHIDEVLITSPAASASGGLSALQSRYTIGRVEHLPVTGRGDDEVRRVIQVVYGTTSILIDENKLPMSGTRAADLIISSSTPAGKYMSDGGAVRF